MSSCPDTGAEQLHFHYRQQPRILLLNPRGRSNSASATRGSRPRTITPGTASRGNLVLVSLSERRVHYESGQRDRRCAASPHSPFEALNITNYQAEIKSRIQLHHFRASPYTSPSNIRYQRSRVALSFSTVTTSARRQQHAFVATYDDHSQQRHTFVSHTTVFNSPHGLARSYYCSSQALRAASWFDPLLQCPAEPDSSGAQQTFVVIQHGSSVYNTLAYLGSPPNDGHIDLNNRNCPRAGHEYSGCEPASSAAPGASR